MTIVDNSNITTTEFDRLSCGDTLKYRNTVFMKILNVKVDGDIVNAVNLLNGQEFAYFYPDKIVTPVKTKVIVE